MSKLSQSITPLGDRVLVQPVEQERVTASGIVIPDTGKPERPQMGTVLALGNGGVGKDCPVPSEFLSVGQTVLFGKYAGDDVPLKGEDGKEVSVKVLKLDSILGIVS